MATPPTPDGSAARLLIGVPLVAGFLTRLVGERRKGTEWYEQRFLPRIGPVALYGLLFTIVVLFALQGDAIASAPFDVARIALPLLSAGGTGWILTAFCIGLLVAIGNGEAAREQAIESTDLDPSPGPDEADVLQTGVTV